MSSLLDSAGYYVHWNSEREKWEGTTTLNGFKGFSHANKSATEALEGIKRVVAALLG